MGVAAASGAAELANGDAETARCTVQAALDRLDPNDRFTPYYEGLMRATLERCNIALRRQEQR